MHLANWKWGQCHSFNKMCYYFIFFLFWYTLVTIFRRVITLRHTFEKLSCSFIHWSSISVLSWSGSLYDPENITYSFICRGTLMSLLACFCEVGGNRKHFLIIKAYYWEMLLLLWISLVSIDWQLDNWEIFIN